MAPYNSLIHGEWSTTPVDVAFAPRSHQTPSEPLCHPTKFCLAECQRTKHKTPRCYLLDIHIDTVSNTF